MNLPKFEEVEALEPIYDKYVDENEDVYPIQGESLVIQRVMTTMSKEEGEDWWRCSIFQAHILCGGKKHSHPYKIRWLKKKNEIPITSQCLVKFTMGGDLDNEALCDIVPMDASHILLGKLWLYYLLHRSSYYI